jgi:hypothetical protein
MPMPPPATPDFEPIALQDLPPARTTGNGCPPPAMSDVPPDLVAFDEQYTVPPEDLETEDVDGALAVPEVGAPGRQSYFRADPTRTWTGRLLRVAESGDYLVLSHGVEHPDAAVYRVHLLTDRKGNLRLWPVRLPANGDDFPTARQQRAILADGHVDVLSVEGRETRALALAAVPGSHGRPALAGGVHAPAHTTRVRWRHDLGSGGSAPARDPADRRLGSPSVQVWAVDFEFGDGPAPRCLVARDLARTRCLRVWEDELRTLSAAPFPVGTDSIMTAYLASAEISCFLALGWALPVHVVDLYAEFRLFMNGRRAPTAGYGLLGALRYFGLPSLDVEEKDTMRALALRGGPWQPGEPEALLTYCQTDVDALLGLWPVLGRRLGWALA